MINKIVISAIVIIYGFGFIYLIYKSRVATREYRQKVTEGDEVRFKYKSKTLTGTVEKVFFKHNTKMLKVRAINPQTHQKTTIYIAAKDIYLKK